MAKAPTISKEKSFILENAITEKPSGVKSVSYSQYKTYRECPHRWKLNYKDALFPFTSSRETVFGTALHETVQHYLTLLYTDSVKASEELNFEEYLFERMVTTYQKEVASNNGQHFVTQEDMQEYYEDGILILDYLRKKRKVLFDYRTVELVAVELPGYVPMMDGYNVVFNFFLDLVFYDRQEGNYIIIDIKTSKSGWNDWAKKDELKLEQLLLYKKYFSKFYNVDPKQVEVKFLIVKRKVADNFDWPIPRHTMFIPAQGTGKVNLAVANIEDFVKKCFNLDGSFKETIHRKTPSSSACKFCPFAGTELCDQKAD